MLALKGDTAAAITWVLGQYWGLSGNPGGDLGLDLAATAARAASERLTSLGDSTGDLNPSEIFCSKILVGVETFDGIDSGVDFVDEGDTLDFLFLGGVQSRDEVLKDSFSWSPLRNEFILFPAMQ